MAETASEHIRLTAIAIAMASSSLALTPHRRASHPEGPSLLFGRVGGSLAPAGRPASERRSPTRPGHGARRAETPSERRQPWRGASAGRRRPVGVRRPSCAVAVGPSSAGERTPTVRRGDAGGGRLGAGEFARKTSSGTARETTRDRSATTDSPVPAALLAPAAAERARAPTDPSSRPPAPSSPQGGGFAGVFRRLDGVDASSRRTRRQWHGSSA